MSKVTESVTSLIHELELSEAQHKVKVEGLLSRLRSVVTFEKDLSMLSFNNVDWAKNEVAIACSGERCKDMTPEEYEYSTICYRSALEAYTAAVNNIANFGISTASMKRILDALFDNRPITPLIGVPAEWVDVSCYGLSSGVSKMYKNSRYGQLFKIVKDTGKIVYRDVGNHFVIDEKEPTVAFHSNYVQLAIDTLYPISFPYCPPERKMEIHAEFCEGGFRITYIIDPSGKNVNVNKYYSTEMDGSIKSISRLKYMTMWKAGVINESK